MYFCLLVGLGIWLYLLLLCIRLSEVYIIKAMSSRIFHFCLDFNLFWVRRCLLKVAPESV